MSAELLKIVSDGGATVIVVLLFLGFLLRALDVLQKMMDKLVESINNNSDRINQVEKKVDTVIYQNKEMKKASEAVYKQSRNNAKKLRDAGIEPSMA